MNEQKNDDILLRYINDTPAMQSLLYDCGLMPEQLSVGTHAWSQMLYIADHWRARELQIAAPSSETMHSRYGDGSDHKCCPQCGMCLTCGDCKCEHRKRQRRAGDNPEFDEGRRWNLNDRRQKAAAPVAETTSISSAEAYAMDCEGYAVLPAAPATPSKFEYETELNRLLRLAKSKLPHEDTYSNRCGTCGKEFAGIGKWNFTCPDCKQPSKLPPPPIPHRASYYGRLHPDAWVVRDCDTLEIRNYAIEQEQRIAELEHALAEWKKDALRWRDELFTLRRENTKPRKDGEGEHGDF